MTQTTKDERVTNNGNSLDIIEDHYTTIHLNEYGVIDNVINYLDEMSLYSLEETYMKPIRDLHQEDDWKTFTNLDDRVQFLFLSQWHCLAELDGSSASSSCPNSVRSKLSRWRPINSDDEQECDRMIATAYQNTKATTTTTILSDLNDNTNVFNCCRSDYRRMMLDRIRGRDFGLSAIFVQSSEVALSHSMDMDCDKTGRTIDSYNRRDCVPQQLANDDMFKQQFHPHHCIPCNDNNDPMTTPNHSRFENDHAKKYDLSSKIDLVSMNRKSKPKGGSILSTTYSFNFERCWAEWFEATRSLYGGAGGTYAFVQLSINDRSSVSSTTTTTTSINTSDVPANVHHYQRHRRHESTIRWQGFRRLIWASWMDCVILDIHLAQLVRQMGWKELDQVLDDRTVHHKTQLKLLLEMVKVTVVVSGTLLVVTGGVHFKDDTGFVFCRCCPVTDRNNRQYATSTTTMAAPISVKLSPDAFNHEVNIQVGMNPETR